LKPVPDDRALLNDPLPQVLEEEAAVVKPDVRRPLADRNHAEDNHVRHAREG